VAYRPTAEKIAILKRLYQFFVIFLKDFGFE